MLARDWFEGIRGRVIALESMERNLELLRGQIGSAGQRFGVMGRGGQARDASAGILRLAQAEDEYDHERASVEAEVDRALEVLYGRDGRGGLAKARSSADADCICGYYLMGMRWREVAEEITRPNSEDGKQWCKRRAYRAMECIDMIGIATLARMYNEGE